MNNTKDILDKEKQKIMIPPEMDRKSYVEGAVDTLNRLEPIVEKLVERAKQEGRKESIVCICEGRGKFDIHSMDRCYKNPK